MEKETIFEQTAKEKSNQPTLDADFPDLGFDDDQSSDGEDFFEQGENEESEESNEPKHRIKTVKRSARPASSEGAAKAGIIALDYPVAMVASAFSGKGVNDHRMPDDFKQEFKEAVALWIEDEAIDWLQPRYVALSMLFGYIVLVVTQVVSARKERKRVRSKINKEVSVIADKVASQKERVRFEINPRGYYMYDVGGVYLKSDEQKEKPTPEIMDIILECRKKGLSKGDTNKIIREKLGIVIPSDGYSYNKPNGHNG